jgi:hypothetical protein
VKKKQKKTMATIFWDYEGLLLCEFLLPTVTYTANLSKNCAKPLNGRGRDDYKLIRV